ncbi:MAG: 2-amino-4-hydroxy-6-hydroxymethyldihydropteridine diphosphokinase [candidate division WOR-3 bacterium]|nr:MAG: 2-amino-4-hydroxy-6-hydroxymethyldihydropteridine diphosphokinase [candidate division WOR-3 bacterium]
MERIYLLLGSNVGNLKENLERAVELIEAHGIEVLKKSKIYKTKPWGVRDQPDFLNMALEVRSGLSAPELLRIFKEIEVEIGREKSAGRWLPRVMDIDILFMDGLVIRQQDLIVPHRDFFNRRFAMRILSEIAPDFKPPGTVKSLSEILSGEPDEGIEVYRD